MKLRVNGQPATLDIPDDVPLLWAIREELGLTGTKFGCGAAQCGAAARARRSSTCRRAP